MTVSQLSTMHPTDDNPESRDRAGTGTSDAPTVIPSVLLIDDDVRMCTLLEEYFRANQIALSCANDGVCGLASALSHRFDVVLLDVMLPRLDGFEVLRQLRRQSAVPVLMLSARVGEQDRLTGLDSGADDYLTKPYSPPELLARVRAMLRRGRLDRREPVLKVLGLTLDVESRLAKASDIDLGLTPIEFQILETLARASGRIVSRDELSRTVHQREASPYDRSLDVHISHLRRKLQAVSGPAIRTIRASGYLLARER
jgi:two-component system response regulator CpxR